MAGAGRNGKRRRTAGGGDDDVLVVDDLAAVKAFADPLRHQIVGLLERPRTVKELATKLDRPPDRLYYHLRVLEQHGFVRAVEERGAERRYELAAESFVIAPGLTLPPSMADDLVGGVLDRVRAEYRAGRENLSPDGERRSMLSLQHVLLTEDERRELERRLQAVTEDFLAREGRQGRSNGARRGRQTFGVVTGLWPVSSDDGD